MGKKIQKIMACIDLSEYSQMTLEYAVELAQGADARILVFNVINQRDVNFVQMASSHVPGYFTNIINVEDYIKDSKKDRMNRLKQLIKENFFEEKSRMSIKVDLGIPFEKILKTVESDKIDLVVMANKGRGNVLRVLFGSAAEKVFRHCPVPVVSVRERQKFKRGE